MKSMFSMGFDQDVFGSRMGNPMLGRVPLRGMGQGVTDGDALLRQMQNAEAQVAADNQYIANHPNLQQDLGVDFSGFQQGMKVVSDSANTETNVAGQLQSTPPGGQYNISGDDLTTVQNYIGAADAIAKIIAAHPNVSPSTSATPSMSPVAPAPAPAMIPPQAPGTRPAPKTVAPTAAKSDLTAPLLVGGGVLAIGVIALLARA